MILHTDVPTRAQLDQLFTVREPSSVSIYLPTNPSSSGDAERIELKNLAAEASRQLQEAGVPKAEVAAIDDELADLVDDDEFWRYQARSLAVFVTPTTSTTFRLANNLTPQVEVSDRFHPKPLLRAVTFPDTAFVLALAQGSVPPAGDRSRHRAGGGRGAPTSRKTSRRHSGRRRSGTAHPAAASRAWRDRRRACASTRGASTRRCGRC